MGGTVTRWFELLPHTEKFLGSFPQIGSEIFLCGVWVLLFPPKSMHHRITGDSKLVPEGMTENMFL